MPLAHRRTPLLIALAVLSLLVAYLAVPPGRAGAAGCGTANAALGRPATASSTENAAPGRQRGRRQPGHPLVERVQRPAVAAGRPRRARDRLRGRR